MSTKGKTKHKCLTPLHSLNLRKVLVFGDVGFFTDTLLKL